MKSINVNLYQTDYYCKSPYSQLSERAVEKFISNIREEPHPKEKKKKKKQMQMFIGRVVNKMLYSATPRRDY